MTTIPRYIGFREKRNGPEVTRDTARSVGRMGVPDRRNNHHAQIITPNPSKNATALHVKQDRPPREGFGTRKCKPTLTAMRIPATCGGLTWMSLMR
jgi:hypothetical protein